MFYGGDRMELSVFGCILSFNADGNIKTCKLIFISAIIENSALMSSLLFGEVAKLFPQTAACSRVTIWTDVGPTFVPTTKWHFCVRNSSRSSADGFAFAFSARSMERAK